MVAASDAGKVQPRGQRRNCAVPTMGYCARYGLRTDLLLVQAQILCTVCDKSTRGQITSDFPKSRQALRAKIFRLTREANHPHISARLTR
jgi:hypothetical protein